MSAEDRPVTADDVAIGDTGPPIDIDPISRLDFVKYAGASGDFVRVHVDEPYAHSLGYESVFQHGMLTAGYAARVLTDWFGPAAVVSFAVRFEAIVWPGDRLKVEGTIQETTARDGSTDFHIDLEARTGAGVVLSGDATVRLPKRV